MIQNKTSKAEEPIVDFLNQHPSPTTEDWKRLIERFPQHAGVIADAAIVRAAGDAADAAVEPYELDEELATRTVSKALNKIHQTTNLYLTKAKKKVDAIRSPAQRKQAAIAVGIGPYPALLNGILSGRTKPPSRVLDALAIMFDVPGFALVELFRRQFEESAVPAFKGRGSKPKLASEPVFWEDAVRGLDLSEKETTRLLELRRKD